MQRTLFPLLGAALAVTAPIQAAVIQQAYVGTLSNNFANNSHASELTRGGKYVVRTSYDTANLTEIDAADRNNLSNNIYVVQLTDDPATLGATNTYELFLPSEGYGTTLTQTGQDHFVIAGFAPTAEIQFFDTCSSAATCASEFRGFEFESNFLRSNSPDTPAVGSDLVFEQFTADVNIAGTPVTNYAVNVLDESLNTVVANAGHIDVLSASDNASGGQLNPGVFFGEAADVVAEAGATPLVYSATTLSVTTAAGTEQVTDPVIPPSSGTLRAAPSSIDGQPRQADNDLGAGRSDGEDFLTFGWTVDGNSIAGNLDGTRLDRIVDTLVVNDPDTEPHGARFVTQGSRTVDDVNISVAIEDSGLTSTTDIATFDLQVQEAYTEKSDTDSVSVSYQNALPEIVSAAAAGAPGGLLFELLLEDPDLDVNALIPSFEVLSVEVLVDLVDYTGFFAALLGTGSQFVDQATLLAEFGAGSHLFEVAVLDRALLAAADTPIKAEFNFQVATAEAPLPATAALLGIGLAGLGAIRRRIGAPTAGRQRRSVIPPRP